MSVAICKSAMLPRGFVTYRSYETLPALSRDGVDFERRDEGGAVSESLVSWKESGKARGYAGNSQKEERAEAVYRAWPGAEKQELKPLQVFESQIAVGAERAESHDRSNRQLVHVSALQTGL